MRRILIGLILTMLLPVTLLSQEERIYTHHSDIVVDTSGVIRVSEKIKIFADGDLFKRGIARSLPRTRTDSENKRIKIQYDIIEVYKDGVEEPFFTEREGDYLVIYIGDKNRLLNPGFYEYEIVYESAGQLGFYEEFDELGWNVNGESDRPVDEVSCNITLPNNTNILSYRCYTGAYGSTDSNCNSESSTDGVFRASTQNLRPGEMMTVYVGFEKGVVAQPKVKETLASRALSLLDKLGLWFINMIIIVPIFFYSLGTWRRHGVNPPKPVVVPQFEPPHGLSPASVGVIYDEGYDNALITTSIINLAIKGYLRIEEIENKGIFSLGGKKYRLVKLKEADSTLPEEESLVLKSFFSDNDEISLGGKYNSTVQKTTLNYQLELNRQHNAMLAEGDNHKYKVLPWLAMLVYIFLLFLLGRNEPSELYITLFGIVLPSFIATAILYTIYSTISKRNPKKILSVSISVAIIVGVIGVFAYFPINRLSSTAIAMLIGLPIMVVGLALYSYMIKRDSEEKLQMQADIEGLKMYISLAEEKQMQFFNPPEITPEVFEKLLPYAIALKVDKIWGDKFEKTLLKSMQTRDAYVPVWYAGTVLRPVNLGSNLRQSLASNITQSAAKPRSTGGNNWGGGSFGGGSVGGGGGGGRTGGW